MKITKKIYLHYSPSLGTDLDANSFSAFGFDAKGMTGYSQAVVVQDVEFEFPAFDPREAAIDVLKNQKAEIIRKATDDASRIEEQIQQLLALPAA